MASNSHHGYREKVFLPIKDYTPLTLSVDPIKIQEDILLVKEVSIGRIYDFNLGLNKFRKLLKSQKKVPSHVDVQIIDQYHLYHYVVCHLPNHKSYAYSDEVLSEEWLSQEKKYRRTISRQYFPEDYHDLDSYQRYHQIVRIIKFQVQYRSFEIVLPRKEGQSLFEPDQNLWIKLRSDCELDFPPDTCFIIKETNEQ